MDFLRKDPLQNFHHAHILKDYLYSWDPLKLNKLVDRSYLHKIWEGKAQKQGGHYFLAQTVIQ